MKKLLVVGVIVLFLGLSVAPSINANINNDSELVEITTEICGMGGGKHTVQLTKEEAEEVDSLLENIRYKLNNTDSREEAKEIFNEAIEELDKYGLLGGLSVRKAQRLVTGSYQRKRIVSVFDRYYKDILSDDDNFMCLVAGVLDDTYDFSILFKIAYATMSNAFDSFFYIFEWLENNGYFILSAFFLLFGILLYPFIMLLSYLLEVPAFNPISLLSTIGLGFHGGSSGWLFCIGLKGLNFYNGKMWGNLTLDFFNKYATDEYPGIHGFSGLEIWLDLDWMGKRFYLGNALRVKITDKRP